MPKHPHDANDDQSHGHTPLGTDELHVAAKRAERVFKRTRHGDTLPTYGTAREGEGNIEGTTVERLLEHQLRRGAEPTDSSTRGRPPSR